MPGPCPVAALEKFLSVGNHAKELTIVSTRQEIKEGSPSEERADVSQSC